MPPRLYLLLLLTLPLVADARTLFVSHDGDGTNGESWEMAYTTINDAVVVAVTDNEVWVRHGVYNESIELATPIVLLGGFSGVETESNLEARDWDANPTIIDATGIAEVISISSIAGGTLDGFTITGGTHSGLNIRFNSMTVRNCIIRGNSSRYCGGGMIIHVGASARILNCQIISNECRWCGGGIAIERGAAVTMENCLIEGNQTRRGGGISIGDSSLVMRRCKIINNKALPNDQNTAYGGGIYCGVPSMVTVENCLFYGNESPNGDHVFDFTETTPAIFNNCTFVSNVGGIVWSDFPPVFRNCLLWGSTSILERYRFDPEGEPNISYTCIQGGHAGTGNISNDPLFMDEAGDNYRIQVSSPCIDSASTTGPPTDLDGNRRPVDVRDAGREGGHAYDMGAYEFPLPPVTGGSGIRVR